MTTALPKLIAYDEWAAEGRKRFGPDENNWRFICPSCGHIASVWEWRVTGATGAEIAFSCIGRRLGADGTHTFKLKGGPCNYAGGGLIRLNPVGVMFPDGAIRPTFSFDRAPERPVEEPPNIGAYAPNEQG
jgi:hypothetical protein